MSVTADREWNSQSYHQLSDFQVSWGKRVLARAPLRGDETVMDAGCGTGRLTADLMAALPRGRVIAVDVSENMLRSAAEHLGGRVWFVLSDLTDLPFNEAVDGIFSTAAFHWVKDHDRLFASLFRSLRAGGWLEAQCGGGPNIKRLTDRAALVMEQADFVSYFAGWSGPWEFASPELTRERLTRAGFTDVETSLEAAPVTLRDERHYREYLETVVFRQHLARIPDAELRSKFLDEVVAPAVQESGFDIDYWRLNLRGRKPA